MVYFNRLGYGGGNGLTKLRLSDDVETVPVKIFRLDDFNLNNIGFMKIDVECHVHQENSEKNYLNILKILDIKLYQLIVGGEQFIATWHGNKYILLQ